MKSEEEEFSLEELKHIQDLSFKIADLMDEVDITIALGALERCRKALLFIVGAVDKLSKN